VILLDANILLGAAGAEHPHKAPSLALLERVATGSIDAGADVEVLQEVLHCYRAIGRWRDGQRVYDLARTIIRTWIPVGVEVLDRARDLLEADATLSARGALHGAVCLEVEADALCSFDHDFDRIAGVRRVAHEQLL
jgi:predicted nucleic acid-binding protein